MVFGDRQAHRPGDGRARLLIALGLAAAIVVATWLLPSSVRRLDNRAAAGAQLSGLYRELPAAQQYGISTTSLERLAATIPQHAVYTFVYPTVGADTAELAFPGVAANYLFPRRVALNGTGARYVIAYRTSLKRASYTHVIDLGDGVEVGTVKP